MKMYQKALRMGALITLITLSSPLGASFGALAMDTPGFQQSSSLAAPFLALEDRDRYTEARENMDADVYMLYRVADRLVRANDIDVPIWNIGIVSDYKVYAYTGEIYTIFFGNAFLDLLDGDVSAIAFTMAHEMAHHETNYFARIDEFERQLRQELFESLGGGAITRETIERNPEYISRFEQFYTAIQMEADQKALEYMARANIDPVGALVTLQAIEKSYGTCAQYTERIAAIRTALAENSFATLNLLGQSRLAVTSPLAFEFLEIENGYLLQVRQHYVDYGANVDALFGP
ncbi:hypothetical protein IQ273_14640 [Nodosilinea sp. LEGE 07298]|uniref:M48 family metalloprotease n=1 Tax=Nodosilinea sp. LEGE 07298 TaxID=2777970 RepID=UPI0018823630|nr:M48 family metalloprotease [Nodosilinea sp. LEGE 07298]MBE9110656.1 hypothetical protein [Nodosilinea sp. LEGE 07298]